MKTKFFTLTLILICRLCTAQNLVPNGDYEQYAGCPNYIGQLDSALYWLNPATNITNLSGTSDYFNQCAFSLVGVPTNMVGFQNAHSGVGYAGLYLITPGVINYREYAETPILPLDVNSCYYFEMYVSLAEQSIYNTTELGVYFSDTLVANINNYFPLPYMPQINNLTVNVFDKINWIVVSGTYTATGNENYIIIGNFKTDANTLYTTTGSGSFGGSYVYIDDVFLTLCTDIQGQNKNSGMSVFPNPFSNKINITTSGNNPAEISLYDVTSRKVIQQSFSKSTAINTAHLSGGIYFYELRDKYGVVKKGKVVKD